MQADICFEVPCSGDSFICFLCYVDISFYRELQAAVKSKSSAMKYVYVDLNDSKTWQEMEPMERNYTDVAMSHSGDLLSVTSVQ